MAKKVDRKNIWWPKSLKHLAGPVTLGEYVTVAEIVENENGYLQTFTALVTTAGAKRLMNHSGEFPHEVSTSGPYPWGPPYKPTFWVWSPFKGVAIEPLVVSWKSGDKTVFLPDQGFLMTYGLSPKCILEDRHDTIHWDERHKPERDIVRGAATSKYHGQVITKMKLEIKRSYLEDYATLRNRTIVQFFYATKWDYWNEEYAECLGDESCRQLPAPGRFLRIAKTEFEGYSVNARAWGVRHLVAPGKRSITGYRDDFSHLKWPGAPSTPGGERQARPWYVYVSDAVLAKYESQPDLYRVSPELGTVSFSNQWGFHYCHRLGRDVIQVEYKDLYEGASGEIEHWHSYAVQRPQGTTDDLVQVPNVATRSKRLVNAFLHLGDVLASTYLQISGDSCTGAKFVGLNRNDVEHKGWWNHPSIRPITDHIPLDLDESTFLARCKLLNSLLVDGLNQKTLRRLVASTGIPNKETSDLRSMKLLQLIVSMAAISAETGLRFPDELKAIQNRRSGSTIDSLSLLFTLNGFRQTDAHPRMKKDINRLLQRLGFTRASVRTGWGLVLDKIYDDLALSLDQTTSILEEIIW